MKEEEKSDIQSNDLIISLNWLKGTAIDIDKISRHEEDITFKVIYKILPDIYNRFVIFRVEVETKIKKEIDEREVKYLRDLIKKSVGELFETAPYNIMTTDKGTVIVFPFYRIIDSSETFR